MKLPASFAKALIVAALSLSACSGGGGGSGGSDAAMTSGKIGCLGIRNCVKDNCGSLSADQSMTCVQDCMDKATAQGQAQYMTLTSCLVTTCCTDEAGCGGGDPKCSQAGTQACDSCTCQAQCNPTNMPCRQAVIACYGVEPDCTQCM